jgi:hypothetical protein
MSENLKVFIHIVKAIERETLFHPFILPSASSSLPPFALRESYITKEKR